jgi:hypothetical protein
MYYPVNQQISWQYRPVNLADPGEHGPACPGNGLSLGHCPLCTDGKQLGALSSL